LGANRKMFAHFETSGLDPKRTFGSRRALYQFAPYSIAGFVVPG